MPAVDLEGWRDRVSVERDTPTSSAVMVEDDESGESDSEGEEPVAIGSEGEEPVAIGAMMSESQVISILRKFRVKVCPLFESFNTSCPFIILLIKTQWSTVYVALYYILCGPGRSVYSLSLLVITVNYSH